ncbi:MAG: CHC2 zinc finger domain-containing protein [Candidatus Hodarchaeota archaeon]
MEEKQDSKRNSFIDFINMVKSECDIVTVAAKLGLLPPKRGRYYQGDCPTGHPSEAHRCFTIFPETQSFYCFHCGVSGDLISLVRIVNDCDTKAALVWVVDNFGLAKPQLKTPELPNWVDEWKKRERAYNVLTEAARYYHENLKANQEMADHLHDHYGLDDDTILSHILGYATGTGLIDYLTSKQFTLEEMVNAGIVVQAVGGHVEFFNGRLVFPYWRGGHVVYMIGRQTKYTPSQPWEKPKYRKLPSTGLVENKYFIGEDTIREAKEIIVAEGVTDALAAIQAGFSCISPVTTRFRKEDVPRLLELTSNAGSIVLVPDNEESRAGMTGALDTAAELEKAGRMVHIVLLPRDEGQEKMDLNEYLRDQGVDAFKACLEQVKRPTQVMIDELGTRQLTDQTLLEEVKPLIEKLASLPEGKRGDEIAYLQEKLGLSDDQMARIREGVESSIKRLQGEASKAQAKEKTTFSAWFDGLVDLVLDEKGNIVFLVKEGGNLVMKNKHEATEVTLIPPPKKKIIWTLPNGSEVVKHFSNDSDTQLFEDLAEYHATISELPNGDHYQYLALWDMHTYLFEKNEYSPITWFYATPERGKTRTGKGVTYVAWRGIRVATLYEAHIIRIATNLKATIFFDVMDLWQKVERAGSEDIILGRFERGIQVPRVLYPEKGPFEDTIYYEVYGPTVIATNEPVSQILETRAVQIIMPESARRFEEDIKPEHGLPFRERLLAFRARWMDKQLPDTEKPVDGRLGDILKPLRQIAKIVCPDEMWFLDFSKALEERRKEGGAESIDGQVVRAIWEAKGRVVHGHLLHEDVLAFINRNRPQRFHMSPHKLGWITKRLGFEKYSSGQQRGIYWNQELIDRLCERYGIEPDIPGFPGIPGF